MVATRRAPAAPASRTNSQQAIPRATSAKGRVSSHIPNVPDLSSPLANGKTREELQHESQTGGSHDVDDPSKKGKGKSKLKKGGKKRKDKKPTLADVLLRYLLLFFTIYSLTVCPSDVQLQSPVCRGLSEYRRLILEPYLLPPLKAAIAHPSIAPHIERARPYAERAVQIATPVVLRTQSEWNNRVVPQWNKVVVPQYYKYVVPQYTKHVVPQLVRASAFVHPYRVAAEQEYEKRLGPSVRFVTTNVGKYTRAAQPYLLLAADKTYAGYQRSKPYLGPVWHRVKLVLKRFLVFLRVQRRKFVDPQVAKIWERVKELSRGERKAEAPTTSPVVKSSPSPTAVPVATPSPEQESEVVEETAPASPAPPSEPVVSASISSTAAVSSSLDAASAVQSSASQSARSARSVTPQSAESVVSAASETASSVVHTESSPPSSATEAASVVPSAIPVYESTIASSESPTTPSSSVSSPTLVSDEDDIDLDAFYADLGISTDDAPDQVEQTQEQPPPPPPELTEEEKARLLLEKRAKTAEKRKDITGRHTKWEQDLEAAIKQGKKTLRKALVALRKAAVEELKSSKKIHGNLDGLVAEAEKFLKGADVYLKNLKKDSRKNEEKESLWNKVVDKLEAKFVERLHETEETVNGWYDDYLAKETAEVTEITQSVRSIADRGQEDIGLDYAWLDDVTYMDWQRYHDLVRRSDNFTKLAVSIQDGSHPTPPINPILTAMEELEGEVQDIIGGFETRLRRIKRSGDQAFGSESPDAEEEEDADETVSPAPEVSILPIPGDQAEPGASISKEPAPVIGRGKAEVEDAFARAEGLVEDKSAEAVASSMADEVAVEAASDASAASAERPAASAAPVHVEL